jgi:hypothetical protein
VADPVDTNGEEVKKNLPEKQRRVVRKEKEKRKKIEIEIEKGMKPMGS